MIFYNKKSIAGLFVLINLLYVTQGISPALDGIYSLMLLMLLAISLFYLFKVNQEFGQSRFIKALNLVVLLITIYGIINIISPTGVSLPNYRPHTYLTNAYRPLLQIYPLYYFCRKGYINDEVIKSWIPLSFMVALIAYYVSNIMLGASMKMGDVEGTSNVGYLIVSLMPLLYFLKKHVVKYILLVLIASFVFLCAKRGAILILVISIAWFIYFDLKNSSIGNKFLGVMLAFIAGVLLFRYLTIVFEESYYLNYLLEKTESGDSSGRDELYGKAWSLIVKSPSLITFLFGHGADSTYGLLGNRAHNDWLEIMLNQGVLGVILYANLWFQIFKIWFRSKSQRYTYIIMGAAIILFFPKTLFSMLYNELSPIACLPFVWCITNVETKLRKNKVRCMVESGAVKKSDKE